jgi:hypothetical protein
MGLADTTFNISRYHVQYVIVHYGNDTYWKPSAQDCFETLRLAYPGGFHIGRAGPHTSGFEVSPPVRLRRPPPGTWIEDKRTMRLDHLVQAR